MKREVWIAPLSVSVAAGRAVGFSGGAEGGHDVVTVDPLEGRAPEQVAGVVVEADKSSTSLPSASHQWVMSDCQTSLGMAASKRRQELRGRLCGSGTTSPAACRMRRIVELEGTRRPSRSRYPAIDERAGVEPVCRELGAQGHDALTDGRGCAARVGVWPPGTGLERLEAALPVWAQDSVQVSPAEAELGGGSGDGQLVRDDLEDGDAVLRHARDCHACPDSPVTYQLSPMS